VVHTAYIFSVGSGVVYSRENSDDMKRGDSTFTTRKKKTSQVNAAAGLAK
jgi:hypothetical protein